MNTDDNIEMTINIGGEFIKLTTPFELQGEVRDAEEAVKEYIGKLKHKAPNTSDVKLIAMAAYQFSYWYNQQYRANMEAQEIAGKDSDRIDSLLASRDLR